MAPVIEVDNVSVELPVYDRNDRSLRRNLLHFGTGGIIKRDVRNRVVVRALDGVSFAAGEGERIGLIGRNGAGKTTLLKVLAGVTEPIWGTAIVRGRVTTLFSVDSVMDPDLTGYENMEFAGTLLGLSKRRVKELTPDIEAFTELGDYLHMPIRTYSAGMKVRLGFALATAVEPEILLLDEAIGAGDAHFVQKAQARANALYARARAIVLASHDGNLLRTLCTRGLVLDHGRLVMDGPIEAALAFYERGERPAA